MCYVCRTNTHEDLAKIRADISDAMQSADVDKASDLVKRTLARFRTDAAAIFASFDGDLSPAFVQASGRLHRTIGRLNALLSCGEMEPWLSLSQSARLRGGLLRLDDIFSNFRDVGSPGAAGKFECTEENP